MDTTKSNLRDIIRRVKDFAVSARIPDACNYDTIRDELLEGYFSLLAGLAHDATGIIVEIGTNIGMGTAALAYGSSLRVEDKPQPVLSFDISGRHVSHANRVLNFLEIDHAGSVLGTSFDAKNLVNPGNLGLAYIDGDHTEHGCLADLANLAPLLGTHGKLVVHDFAPSGPDQNGVRPACRSFLRSHPEWSAVYLGHSIVVIGSFAAGVLR